MQRICKSVYLALDGLHSEVCRLNSIERTVQRTPRNNLKEENASVDFPTEDTLAEHSARDAALHHVNKVRIYISCVEGTGGLRFIDHLSHPTCHLNNLTGII
jgi:hypothetical protein